MNVLLLLLLLLVNGQTDGGAFDARYVCLPLPFWGVHFVPSLCFLFLLNFSFFPIHYKIHVLCFSELWLLLIPRSNDNDVIRFAYC